ncbi:photosystem II reaction center W protein, chloroplastic-like [Cucurbita maxima]|uniref:PSII 6.1 kDa protein n=1 Tax=Cucurbita maxima TaxID=3661 RepID=A0A6J1KED2_CUCMA|nr:photosystem II reaction center W protein, chloroplastic-like [Cucurbita maxima]XP_022999106.1 photosystem II reaction center W protein, chloroplastic-like [Cucurbita maxima]
MASSLLSPSRILLKGSSMILPSPLMAAHRLPKMKRRAIKCKAEEKREGKRSEERMVSGTVAAVAMATMAAAGPAVALVDERLSTEGTGLPFGLSNNLLGWILVGMFGLIWSLYFVYASSLDEDDDSGLSL